VRNRRVVAKPKKPIDALATLGSILSEDEMENRDAVHIAVLPVVANNDLSPGEHVGFTDIDELAVDTSCDKHIGIIDPFLPRVVKAGESCYLFLYPRTITSLAHHWVHPDVPNVEQVATTEQKATSLEAARRYLQDYCDGADYNTPSYTVLMQSAINSLEWPDEYMTIQGEDASGDIPHEVMACLRTVLVAEGHAIPDRWNPTYYSCSC